MADVWVGRVMGQAIGGVLASAVGVALSPAPVIAVILMLGTRRARSNGIAFSIGWMAGLSTVSVVVLTVTHGASTSGSDVAAGVRWGSVALGVVFLGLAVRQLRRRPGSGEAHATPRWMATIDRFSSPRSAAFGLMRSGANAKNLTLTATAAAAVGQAGLSAGGEAVAVAVFVLVASLTVAGPVVVFLASPRAAARPLDAIKAFMTAHDAVIVFVVLLVLGVKLIGDGVAGR